MTVTDVSTTYAVVIVRVKVFDRETSETSESLTLKMITAQVVETSVTVNNDSPVQDYVHPDDQPQPTFEVTPGFKPFTVVFYIPREPDK